MLVKGTAVDLVILVITAIGIAYFGWKTKKGKEYRLRTFPAIEAIDEICGRAAEMGRPVHFAPGDVAYLTGINAPMTIAAMSILRYTARKCAEKGARLIATCGGYQGAGSDLIPLMQDVVRSGYMEAGKAEEYDPSIVRFISPEQQAYVAGTIGLFAREKIAGNIMVGAWAGAHPAVAEYGFRVGAIQVGGTARGMIMGPLSVMCQYILITDELYAAGAAISKEPEQIGSLMVEEVLKYIAVGITLVGALLITVGIPLIKDLLAM